MKHIQGRIWSIRLLAVAVTVALVAAFAVSVGAQTAPGEWTVPTVSSQPSNIASDPTSTDLWFTEFAGNKIGRISQNGVFQEREVPTPNSQPWGILVDSSGRVWFTEYAGNKIGNIAPGNGSFGQDNIPTANSQPTGLTIDSSGNLWFAESNANKIGRFTPSNSGWSEFNIPTSNSQPWAVVADSAGSIWFTERAGNKIGRLVVQGSSQQFTEFGIPTSGSGPTGIAIDASGNIWFTEYDANKIGMMNPQTGIFIEYNLSSGAKPTWVAADKSGAVWATESGTNLFARVSNGTVTEYGLSAANSTPFGIAVDANGSIWITEQSANRIAKADRIASMATPTPILPTATPVPTATPMPPAPLAVHDNRWFSQTAYRIDNDVFWDYFNKRGGVRTFGYPVSRTFTFQGFTTQFFQREILQLGPDGNARTMNILDAGLMPYTRINGSTFPAPDQSLANLAPSPSNPDYGSQVQEFIVKYAPNQYQGLNVNFYQAFQNTVTLADAFPQGGGNPGLLSLLNLELWGVPTSYPQRDPNNSNFVYLRFQRGIMHYDASNGYTQGLLLSDYLKSTMTGQNIPSDLDSQASTSPFYKQYNPNKANWVDRPDQLPGTNLVYAFEKQ